MRSKKFQKSSCIIDNYATCQQKEENAIHAVQRVLEPHAVIFGNTVIMIYTHISHNFSLG